MQNNWYWILRWGWWMCWLFLLSGVIKLMVVQQRQLAGRAWRNRVEEQYIPAKRGAIWDGKGRLVASSIYQYFVVDSEGRWGLVGEGEYDAKMFEGENIRVELKRKYRYGESMGLVTGYVAGSQEEEMEDCGIDKSYQKGAEVGRSGVEQFFECNLRGKWGRRLTETDAVGKYSREVGRVDPVAGDDLRLAVDVGWQEKIYKMFGENQRGVVVISRPDTGEILVMVSKPGFEANAFSYQRDNEKINRYLSDEQNWPMLNRVIGARYQPGSTFKLAVAMAGLESGIINKDWQIEDTGVLKVGDYSYSNWLWNKRGQTDGMVSIVKAIQRSNDIYFYRLGGEVGARRIAQYANDFGLGVKTGIEMPGEVSGLVPDENWKWETKNEKWFLGNTYHLAIGQGDVAVTPLQINLMTATLANRGKKCRPTILAKDIGDCQDMGWGAGNVATIIEGMEAACKTGGTAWPLFNFKTKIACKTGTAELGGGSEDTHAWLTAFAPIEKPEVAITVLVERGGEGSDVAAPIVGDILKEWLGEVEKDTVVPRKTTTEVGE